METLYDRDFLIWSEEQADLLRRLAAGERVNDRLDWENLVEEVESLGRSQFSSVESQLRVALAHLLLIHTAAQPEPVAHWRGEAVTALFNALNCASPSMVGRLDMQKIWSAARTVVRNKLGDDGGPRLSECPFTAAELLNPDPDIDALLAHLDTAPPP